MAIHETKQGLRYTISEAARREVLDRLLALNHQRHAEEEAEKNRLAAQVKAEHQAWSQGQEPMAATP